jgi:cholesterol transport system auxiliary component
VNRPAAIAIVLAAVCAAACTGSLFQSKAAPPTIYLLSAGAAPASAAPSGDAAPAAAIPVDLAILKPRMRTGLATDRIAVLYPDRRLDYFADARWSGPAGDVLQDLAVQVFLHSRAHLRTVSGDASVFASAYWLEIEVIDFQAEYTSASAAPTAHVHFLARIGESGDRHILGRFETEARQPAAENRLTAIVDAYARAADAALAEIAVQADGALANTPAARH